MKRSLKRMTAVILTAVILTACGQQAGEEEVMRIQSKADVRLLDYPVTRTYDRAFAQGINNFAYGMAGRLSER